MSHWSCTDVYSTRTSVNERLWKYVTVIVCTWHSVHTAGGTGREGERESEANYIINVDPDPS